MHGIPDTPVDVYVNGKKTLDNFKPGTVAGPLDLAEGNYDIALTKPGEPIGSAILKVDNARGPGRREHQHRRAPRRRRQAEDHPVRQRRRQGRRRQGPADRPAHRGRTRPSTCAPAAQPVFKDLTNPNEAKADVDAGTVKADVVLAGTDTVVIGPADLNLKEGTATIVYAIGSAEDKTLDVVAQTITGLHSAPGGVPSGHRRPGRHRAVGTWWYVLAGAGVRPAARSVAVRGRRPRGPRRK